MSKLSGRCDLYDTISGMGGWHDKEGNAFEFGQDGVNYYYPDLLKDFEAFKKLTNGVIYQHKEVKIKDWFGDEEFEFIKSANCDLFDYKKNSIKIADKRCKDGFKEVVNYTFTYFDNKYSLKEIKKRKIFVKVPIYFNTLLDLLPYLPYVVSFSAGSTYIITEQSGSDADRDDCISYAHDSLRFKHYKKELADLYLEVCREYFLKDIDNRTHVETICIKKMFDQDGKENFYYTETKYPIDYMHDIEFVWEDGISTSYWTSPKLCTKIIGSENKVIISNQDVEQLLKNDIATGRVKIKYISKISYNKI